MLISISGDESVQCHLDPLFMIFFIVTIYTECRSSFLIKQWCQRFAGRGSKATQFDWKVFSHQMVIWKTTTMFSSNSERQENKTTTAYSQEISKDRTRMSELEDWPNMYPSQHSSNKVLYSNLLVYQTMNKHFTHQLWNYLLLMLDKWTTLGRPCILESQCLGTHHLLLSECFESQWLQGKRQVHFHNTLTTFALIGIMTFSH